MTFAVNQAMLFFLKDQHGDLTISALVFGSSCRALASTRGH